MSGIAAFFQRLPVDQITAEAKAIHPGRALLTFIGGVLWMVGWLAGRLVVGVWLVLAWSFAAVRVGFREARKPADDDGGG